MKKLSNTEVELKKTLLVVIKVFKKRLVITVVCTARTALKELY